MSKFGPPSDPVEYVFGQFRFDVAARKLWRGEQELHLAARVCEALVVLLRHRDRVVTKEELIRAIWPDSFVSDDSLTQCIWSARRVLGDVASQPRFVVTVPRRGYRFIAPVTVRSPRDADSPDVAPASTAGDDESAPDIRPDARDVGPRRLRWSGAVIGVAAAVSAAVLVAAYLPRSEPPRPAFGPIRTGLDLPAGTRMLSDAVLSPDSRLIAFVAHDDETGHTRLWVRNLSSREARPLSGTDGATRPFWAPGGDALGFFSNGWLKVVSLNAPVPRTLASAGLNPAGGTWSRAGQILFAGSRSGLQLVSADGGRVEAATMLDVEHQDLGHRWPHFLPDGRHFIYTVVSRDGGRAGAYVGSLAGSPAVRLLEPPVSFATYAESGHLLYLRDDTLLAQRFDLRARRPRGAARAVASNVSSPNVLNGAAISATAAGLLTLPRGPAGGRLIWFDRAGARLGAVDAPVPLHNLALSPDGQELLADTNNENDGVLDGVWRLDLARGTRTRIGAGSSPVWSPDGRKFAWAAASQGDVSDLYLEPSLPGTKRELLLQTPEPKSLSDWSHDGRHLVYRSSARLWVLPLDGHRKPTPFLETPFEELQARISPDGRWLAYTSNESGRWEVYVQSFPVAGSKHVVSTTGGVEPLWRADGRELFYVTPTNVLVSVAVTPGETWQNGIAQPLFKAQLNGDPMMYRSRYQVTADGSRILMDVAEDPTAQDVTLVVNWLAILEP